MFFGSTLALFAVLCIWSSSLHDGHLGVPPTSVIQAQLHSKEFAVAADKAENRMNQPWRTGSQAGTVSLDKKTKLLKQINVRPSTNGGSTTVNKRRTKPSHVSHDHFAQQQNSAQYKDVSLEMLTTVGPANGRYTFENLQASQMMKNKIRDTKEDLAALDRSIKENIAYHQKQEQQAQQAQRVQREQRAEQEKNKLQQHKERITAALEQSYAKKVNGDPQRTGLIMDPVNFLPPANRPVPSSSGLVMPEPQHYPNQYTHPKFGMQQPRTGQFNHKVGNGSTTKSSVWQTQYIPPPKAISRKDIQQWLNQT